MLQQGTITYSHHQNYLLLALVVITTTIFNVACDRHRTAVKIEAAAKPVEQINLQNKEALATPNITILRVDQKLTQDLQRGQTHNYLINLKAGNYCQGVVEQKGIDVVVLIYAPDGEKIYEKDSPTGSQGTEVIKLIAQTSGDYRIEVKPWIYEVQAGHYDIKIEVIRVPTEQDQALIEAEQLDKEVMKLLDAGKFSEGIPLAEQALAIKEKVLNPEHPDISDTLNNLGFLYQERGEYEKAAVFLERSLAILEKAFGPEHPAVGEASNNLGILYGIKGDYAKAEPLYQRALAIKEKVFGSEHPSIVPSLSNLGIVYGAKGDYAKAESLYQRALAIDEKAYGSEHPNIVPVLNDLGFLYGIKGDYAKAESLYQRALAIDEKAYGLEHPSVANALNSLGLLYQAKGDYAKAEPLYQRALAIDEKVFGSEHPHTNSILNNLGELYRARGDYDKAELFYQRTLAIREKIFGLEKPLLVIPLNGLGLLYETKGDYDKAESHYQRALEIAEKAFGSEHSRIPTLLSNLGNVYKIKGEYEKAEPLFQRALAISEKVLGPEHPDIASIVGKLGLLYHAKGEYTKVEPLYQRSLAIIEKTLGPEHPFMAIVLNNLGELYRAKREYTKIEPVLQRSLAIREKALGQEHPLVASSLYNLATLYLTKGQLAEAINYQTRANDAREHDLLRNLVAGSENQKLLYLNTTLNELHFTLSLHLQFAPNNKIVRNSAVETLLRRKGRALDAMADSVETLRRRADTRDQSLLDELAQARNQLSTLTLQGPDKEPIQHYRSKLTKLEQHIQSLEAQISTRSAEFRTQLQPITLVAVQTAIPKDAVLVEFAAYHPYDAKTDKYGSAHYAVYLLTNNGEPQWAELGEAEPINKAVQSLRALLRNPQSDIERDIKRQARALDELLMRPVRSLTGSTRRLMLSPDGLLNLLPFEALVDEQNRYLIESYEISYLTSGRDLLRLQTHLHSQQPPLIIADPDFAIGPGPRLGDKVFQPLQRLVATAQEAVEIKARLTDAKLLLQNTATKDALKDVHRPLLLHIATHGFFLEEQATTLPTQADQRLAVRTMAEAIPTGVKLENPLLRSGLFLAGANAKSAETTLTALEVTGLDLWGTKLVTLSACDTAVGEVKNGDGVYGLRRALVLAGSESQLMSLWPVSDISTKDLMVAYYQALQAGEGRSAGLHKVKLAMLANPRCSHPYYWASFIQSGAWTNLAGK
ncbi:MAG: tetratricopeptide repeat protein [Acidobacteriota bacterium]